QDYNQAVAWYRKAAEQGHAKAQFNLGVMYKKGQGVPQDYAQAYMWLNLAAAKGLENAVKTRDNLVKKLTPSQIEEGQRLAREWITTHSKAQAAQ
ncbi:MAG: tetratricopeptide repeat protein, partial [Methylococcaceae bacterium]